MANRPEDCNIVFLETNLDTRFLILSHKDDTVSDFKNSKRATVLFSVFKGITTTDWFVFVDAVKDDSLPLAEKPKAVEKKTKKKKSKTLDERKTRKKHSASTHRSEVAAATNTSTDDESREICEKVCVDAERLDDHNEAIKQVGEKIDGVVAHQEKEVAVIPNDFFFGQKGYESLEKNGIKTGENQEIFDEKKVEIPDTKRVAKGKQIVTESFVVMENVKSEAIVLQKKDFKRITRSATEESGEYTFQQLDMAPKINRKSGSIKTRKQKPQVEETEHKNSEERDGKRKEADETSRHISSDKVDLSKMTLGEWFDYMEVYLRKKIMDGPCNQTIHLKLSYSNPLYRLIYVY
ncbi:unnamed protein product [Cochlearia groenlandica]